MPLQNRSVTCDICGYEEREKAFGAGFAGWCIVNGIGAREPGEGESIQNEHLEMYICPDCRTDVSILINELQEAKK